MKPSVMLALMATAVMAQTYRVPLAVRWSEQQPLYLGLNLEEDDATHLHATLPGGGDLRIERMAAPLNGLVVHVPDATPATVALLPGQQTRVLLNRTVGQAKPVPYVIEYTRTEHDGAVRESFGWIPAYRAEGTLRLPGCEVNVAVLDLNGDGSFDRQDFLRAATLGLDINHDGRFAGPGEWRKMGELLELCGPPLEVLDVDPTGVSITFQASTLKPVRIGEKLPPFSVPATNGTLLRTLDLHGKVSVLDFWASWCGVCVSDLDNLEALGKERANEVQVYGVDVDEREGREAADKILTAKQRSFPMVIREQGEGDYIWRMFGSLPGAHLTVPFYVVVDRLGVVRYGGDKFDEVKKIVEQLK